MTIGKRKRADGKDGQSSVETVHGNRGETAADLSALRCTKPFVTHVVKIAMYLSSQLEANRFSAESVFEKRAVQDSSAEIPTDIVMTDGKPAGMTEATAKPMNSSK